MLVILLFWGITKLPKCGPIGRFFLGEEKGEKVLVDGYMRNKLGLDSDLDMDKLSLVELAVAKEELQEELSHCYKYGSPRAAGVPYGAMAAQVYCRIMLDAVSTEVRYGDTRLIIDLMETAMGIAAIVTYIMVRNQFPETACAVHLVPGTWSVLFDFASKILGTDLAYATTSSVLSAYALATRCPWCEESAVDPIHDRELGYSTPLSSYTIAMHYRFARQ
eukprot:3659186-Rhodomonas_salina.1